jgi:hypothetical protein
MFSWCGQKAEGRRYPIFPSDRGERSPTAGLLIAEFGLSKDVALRGSVSRADLGNGTNGQM